MPGFGRAAERPGRWDIERDSESKDDGAAASPVPAADGATRRAEDAIVEQVQPKKMLTPLRRRTLIATVLALVTV